MKLAAIIADETLSDRDTAHKHNSFMCFPTEVKEKRSEIYGERGGDACYVATQVCRKKRRSCSCYLWPLFDKQSDSCVKIKQIMETELLVCCWPAAATASPDTRFPVTSKRSKFECLLHTRIIREAKQQLVQTLLRCEWRNTDTLLTDIGSHDRQTARRH